jgi:hypothetical protein
VACVKHFANDLIFYFGSTQVAEVLGRQIIEELNLPPEKRTITPEQGIGEAGGTKYILVLTLPLPCASRLIASPRIASREQLSSAVAVAGRQSGTHA